MEYDNDELEDTDEQSPDLYEHHSFKVDKGQQLLRIDKFLVSRMESTSRSRIQAAAMAGSILVNGLPVKSNYRVKPLDTVTIVLPYPPRNHEIIPQNIPLDIVYEDDQVMVINKPAGMVVHPGHGNFEGTLVNALYYYFKDLPLFQSGDIRAGLVHRIDKDTSGLLLIAKTEMAHIHLARQFFDHTTKRQYVAIVWGVPEPPEGTIVGNIGRSIRDRKKMQVYPPDSDQGKHAITHYRVLNNLSYVSVVQCQLETGRTHQIRAHFEHIGHPLFSDEKYGGRQILKGTTFSKYKRFVEHCFEVLPRQALHARSIGFVHPATGQEMLFESALPPDMQGVIASFTRYLGGRDIDE